MRITFSAFLFLLFTRLHAQTTADFTVLSANEGLSQGMVFDILQTRDDFLWIATKDGLNRYDGYRFKIFSPDPFDPFSIAASEVTHLQEDKRGWLWVSHAGGLDVYMPENGRFFHLPLPEWKIDPHIAYFLEKPDGSVWVANPVAVFKLNGIETALKKAAAVGQPFPDFAWTKTDFPTVGNHVGGRLGLTRTDLTRNKSLLIGSNNGIYRIDPATGKPDAQPEFLSGELCQLLGEDDSGGVWFGMFARLIYVQKNKGAPLLRLTASPGYWHFDEGGNLWHIAGNKLKRWKPSVLAAGGEPEQVFSLESYSVSQAFYPTKVTMDRTGNVWVGTSGYGLFKLDIAKPKFSSYLPVTSHRALVEDPAGGLVSLAFPRQMYKGKQFDRPMPNPWFEKIPPEVAFIGPVQFDGEGNCWVWMTYGGANPLLLGRIDARTKEVRMFQGIGKGNFRNKAGKLLSLAEDGIIEFDPATLKFTKHPFPKPMPLKFDDFIVSMNYFYEDSQGVLWINGYDNLLKATPSAGGYRFEQFVNNPVDRSSISNNQVLCVVEDPLEPARYLWVGTKGGGLNRLDRQAGKFAHFKTEQGLPDNVIYGILSDRAGNLWMSTNKGLCRMSATDGRQEDGSPIYHFKNFTAADGLQSNEFNRSSYLKTKDGTMIFGGVNGLTVFHPDSLRFNENVPLTHIVGIQVNNEKLEIGKLENWKIGDSISQFPNFPISLNHHQNLLTFEFAALDFTNPAQNQYRYQLVRKRLIGKNEGENWVDLGEKNSVQFANLQPGSYTFRVLGSNNDGAWSEQPATLNFTIRPPWWASWWAYLGYAFLLGALVWLYNRHQLRQKLEHQENLRLKELDEFKSRFFTNITHEFRTPLTVILGNLEIEKLEIGKFLQSEDNPKISQFLNFLISKNTLTRRSGENLLRLINQLLDLAKLESKSLKINYVQDDVLPYLRYISESLHSLANAQNVMLRVESKEPEIIMDYDPERLLQIVHNLLSNAIKFTPSGGKVTLKAEIGKLEIGKLSGSAISQFPISQFLISVSDTGVGIPAADLPNIFDRFYQANTPPSGGRGAVKAGGTGIGLALTKELVHALGGDISVESEVGAGTTFTVRLPISNKAATSDGVTSSHPVTSDTANLGGNFKLPPKLTSDNGEQPAILLIEDNPDVVEYLAACLSGSGEPPYLLDFAYNGRAGIEKALETIPDLIVSDVMMPEKDGFEVVETLKNDERTSHIPIILLTAKADVESRLKGLKRGADAYLSKPFHQEELLVTLANLLELRRKLQARYQQLAVGSLQLADQSPITNHQFTPSGSPLPDPEDAFLQKLRTALEERLGDAGLTAEDICRAVGMGRSNLYAKLSALTGLSFNIYLRSLRLRRGKELLLTTHMNVSEVAYQVGFNDPKYFGRVFMEEFGIPPSELKR